eukprot:1087930-Amphidinium_carterae.2
MCFCRSCSVGAPGGPGTFAMASSATSASRPSVMMAFSCHASFLLRSALAAKPERIKALPAACSSSSMGAMLAGHFPCCSCFPSTGC